jgi:outer membrane receptor protein involved in Fe transport
MINSEPQGEAMQIQKSAGRLGVAGVGYFDRTDPATFQRAYALLDLRTGIVHGAWEVNLFLDNVFDKHAALSRFISDNYDASTRSRIFTNRPRTAGLSLEWKF